MSLNNRILLPAGFSFLLLIARIIITGELTYIFLAWNLFLAWIPFAVGYVLCSGKEVKRLKLFFLLAAWLLFLPNAPYIITDLLHLKERQPVPYWYDVLLLFSASFSGLMLGLVSVYKVDNFLSARFSKRKTTLFVLASFFLSGFGIYIGRYLRWNSWDIFLNTAALTNEIADRLLNPLDHFRTWSVTLFFGTFLSLVYFSVKNMITIQND
jgi:uncharacterized membrane protein